MAKGHPPNVVLMGIDLLLNNHMSGYGYPKQTTPHIHEALPNLTGNRIRLSIDNRYSTPRRSLSPGRWARTTTSKRLCPLRRRGRT